MSTVAYMRTDGEDHNWWGGIGDNGEFVCKVNGQIYRLDDAVAVAFEYVKRDRQELQTLRDAFNAGAKQEFVKWVAASHADQLRTVGLSEQQIAKALSSGTLNEYGRREFEVHHVRPLDDGGNNHFSNMVIVATGAHRPPCHAMHAAQARATLPGGKFQIVLMVPKPGVFAMGPPHNIHVFTPRAK